MCRKSTIHTQCEDTRHQVLLFIRADVNKSLNANRVEFEILIL